MTKIFLDTNVWLRFFLKDQETQFELSKKIIEASESGTLQLYASAIVFLEITYVLKSVYKLSTDEIIEYLERIKNIRNITIIEQTDTELAINYLKTTRIKFTDCLLASQMRKDIILVTYDEELSKIKDLTIKTPEQVLNS